MQQKGYTLIELMITVAIIAILAAVTIPSYNDYLGRSEAEEIVITTLPQKILVAIACRTERGNCTDVRNAIVIDGAPDYSKGIFTVSGTIYD